MALASIPDIIDDIRAGKMVVLMDDEDRENEGDLIIAAEKVTPEIINFMATEACGLICMPITPERARQLRIPLMVRDNRSQHETNFTVSIDATEQIAPGVSARQRAHTILKAIEDKAMPADIRQPGHIFPLVAKPGGVLRRAGHTEAGVDLARMAGCEPAAVIVEIMNADGTMARRPELEIFARQHDLKMGTIADLIEYRSLHEHSITPCETHAINTEWGDFTLHAFRDDIDDITHFALQRGSIPADTPIPVRVQPVSLLRDVIGNQPKDTATGWSYRSAMAHLEREGAGVVVLIGQQNSADQTLDEINHFLGAKSRPAQPQNYRLIGTGAQILRHLGVSKMQLLSAPIRFNALSGFNLEVCEFLSHPEDS